MPSLATTLRTLGAVALFAVAADHLYEYYVDQYSTVPTIGPLFLLNGIGAVGLGLALLVPFERLLPARYGQPAVNATALAGITLAAATLAGLIVSEHTPLFGFREYGYRTVIVLAIAAEAAAIVLLSAFLTAQRIVPARQALA
jgi:hypothetical protein